MPPDLDGFLLRGRVELQRVGNVTLELWVSAAIATAAACRPSRRASAARTERRWLRATGQRSWPIDASNVERTRSRSRTAANSRDFGRAGRVRAQAQPDRAGCEQRQLLIAHRRPPSSRARPAAARSSRPTGPAWNCHSAGWMRGVAAAGRLARFERQRGGGDVARRQAVSLGNCGDDPRRGKPGDQYPVASKEAMSSVHADARDVLLAAAGQEASGKAGDGRIPAA